MSFFFGQQKSAYDWRISDWSSHVCSSDLEPVTFAARLEGVDLDALHGELLVTGTASGTPWQQRLALGDLTAAPGVASVWARAKLTQIEDGLYRSGADADRAAIRAQALALALEHRRSEEHTSELQSLMRISYAVFCLKKKNTQTHQA